MSELIANAIAISGLVLVMVGIGVVKRALAGRRAK